MKIGFAQINPTVGDLTGNFEKIAAAYDRLVAAGAELVITPELAITGYPPQDLVFKSRFVPQNIELVEQLHARVSTAPLLVGFVDRNEGRGKPFHNSAALLQRGVPMQKVHKSLLPTYDVFDEDRYFEPGLSVEPFLIGGHKVGVTICEDIWTETYLPRPYYDVDPVGCLVEKGRGVDRQSERFPVQRRQAADAARVARLDRLQLSRADFLLQRCRAETTSSSSMATRSR
jgi:predicted amidohydrolase